MSTPKSRLAQKSALRTMRSEATKRRRIAAVMALAGQQQLTSLVPPTPTPTTTTTTHEDDGRRFLATDNLKSIFDEARSGAPKLRFFVTATVQGSAPHKPAAEVEAEVVLLPR
mmetsp:Transcript_15320/g.38741  ORF Transcript_15320/g.38741 Transcript_15320/m.38741 type:complete len:113 (-) Transcript_15320:4-342(-)